MSMMITMDTGFKVIWAIWLARNQDIWPRSTGEVASFLTTIGHSEFKSEFDGKQTFDT